MYDGALTADVQLSDVRPGDALETWFTIVGSNPAVKGAFDASLALAFSVPVEQTFLRLRAPSDRKLIIKVQPDGAEAEFEQGEPAPGVTDREWRASREQPFLYADSTPPWWAGHKRVNMDDEMTWGEFAELFRAAYAPPSSLPPDIEAEAQRIEALSPNPATRAIEALRFVQSSIRYLAIAIGDGGFIPRDVEQIWGSRFGDCKDVSRLLAALLVRLGVKAAPALVSTLGKDPRRTPPPHVYAFNHCIVRAEVDGVVRWLDPTNAGQGGDFARICQPPFEWALPLIEGADIEQMKITESNLPVIDKKERITFGARPTDPVQLLIETLSRDWRADQLRAAQRANGAAVLSEHWRKFYADAYGGATMIAPAEISDDIDANELKTIERYTLEKAWRVEDSVANFSHVDTLVTPDINVIPHAGRTQPLWLGLARRFHRTTTFIASVRWRVATWDERADGGGIKGFATLLPSLHDSKQFELEVDYAITRDFIETEQFDAFVAGLARLRRGASLNMGVPLRKGEFIAHELVKPPKGPGKAFNIGMRILFVAIILMYVLAIFKPDWLAWMR
jgi:hypothetical protein